nr:class I SAM-dependent methyltransferase [Nitriliruptor alkaliphilus]
MPDREEVFARMLDVAERLVGPPARVLDLACGPGSLAARAVARFPDAEVVAVDLDPVLLALGRAASVPRTTWLDADLRVDGWDAELPTEGFDLVLSATALHWLDADRWPSLAGSLARLLRPAGLFLDYDQMRTDADAPQLAALTDALHREPWEAIGDGAEDWAAWWAAVADSPAFAPLLTERDRRFDGRRVGSGSSVGERVAALRAAGFDEVAPLEQVADRRLLAAIR